MKALIGKWGKSAAVRLPKEIADELGLKPGDEVSIEVEGRRLVVRPKATRKYDPESIFKEMEGEEPPELIDWGPPVGKEIW